MNVLELLNKRHRLLPSLKVVSVFFLQALTQSAEEVARPNVVIIIADVLIQ